MMTNEELINRYPWLTPRNRFTDQPYKNEEYLYTELDAMPEGWRKAFGEQMCEEMNQEMLTWSKKEYDGFRIMQIKEKWGALRVYVNYGSEKLYDIIAKYTTTSRVTCLQCGRPAKWISRGWICPWCDDCAVENLHAYGLDDDQFLDKFMSIQEYYEKEED